MLGSLLILQLRKGKKLSSKFMVWWVRGIEESQVLKPGSVDPEMSVD